MVKHSIRDELSRPARMATIKERFQQAKDLFESRGTDAASLHEAELLCNGVIEANAKHAKAHQV